MSTRLAALINIALIIAIVVDLSLVVMVTVAPDLWFDLLHGEAEVPRNVVLLRRAGAHWFAFLVFQVAALTQWRRQPLWLVFIAGLRFSDLFTDATYLAVGDDLTPLAWASLSTPPFLNLGMGLLCLHGFRQTVSAADSSGST